jgi:hypothetical protein
VAEPTGVDRRVLVVPPKTDRALGKAQKNSPTLFFGVHGCSALLTIRLQAWPAMTNVAFVAFVLTLWLQKLAGGLAACVCPEGTFKDSLAIVRDDVEEGLCESEACSLCPAGRFQFRPSTAPCKLCAEGSASLIGARNCTACPPGTFYVFNGTTMCQDCPMGTHSEAPGQLGCLDCELGRYHADPGGVECTVCSAGRFANR